MNLSSIFIRRPVMTCLSMLTILFFGLVSYLGLPVSDLPNVDLPTITVSVSYPGANPTTMANNVTVPLEKEFLTIPNLETIASTSSTGSSTIVLQFALNKSIDVAAQDVQSAINRATPQLPQDLPYAPTYTKTNPSMAPVMYAALTSATIPLGEMYNYASTYIGERLSLIDGVANVVTFGSPFAMRVQVNPQKLAAKGIGINDVATTIQNQNVYLPTGTLYGNKREMTINVDGQMDQADAYNAIILKNENGSIVRLSDVGKAFNSIAEDKLYETYVTEKDSLACIVFAVQTQPGVNMLSVVKRINEVMPTLEAGLPKAIQLHKLFDRSIFIEESVHDVEMTLFIAFALVVFVIYLYLGRAMNTLIPSLALPMSILGTFIVMNVFGYSIDILSLLAITLSIGFLVDDAIVVLENIVRHTEHKQSSLEAALDGSKEISFTIVSMTLCLIAVFIPMLFMGGVVGKLFKEFAVVIVTAVLISGFISLSLTPMLCSRLIPPRNIVTRMERFSENLNDKLVAKYRSSLQWTLHHRKTALCIAIGSLVLSVLTLRLLPKEFFPPDDLGLIVVHTQAADGTSPFQMKRYQDTLGEIVRKNKYIASTTVLSGSPDSNKGILFIRLKPFNERPPLQEIMNELHPQFSAIPGVASYLKPLPLINLQASTSDIKGIYQYTLQSLNAHDLYKYSGILLDQIKKTPGFAQVSTDLEITQPQLNLEILRDRASVLNISAHDIENALTLAYADGNLSPINEPDNQYYVIMELEPKFYRAPEALSQIYLRSSTNDLVPLSAVARQSQDLGPLIINRINGLPAVNISFNLTDIPLSTAVTELENLARKTLPATVTAQAQGTASIFQSSFANLNALLLITIFIIYVILGILYENFFHPITVMSTLPPAALGGLLTLVLFNQALSIYAFMGVILLLGIVMKNGIIMVDFANEAVISGKEAEEAIIHASTTRFRPILMTTFSALMGAVPIALGIGGMTAQGRRPLGLVIIGGLIFSQILTLYLTPVIYLYIEHLRTRIAKRLHRS